MQLFKASGLGRMDSWVGTHTFTMTRAVNPGERLVVFITAFHMAPVSCTVAGNTLTRDAIQDYVALFSIVAGSSIPSGSTVSIGMSGSTSAKFGAIVLTDAPDVGPTLASLQSPNASWSLTDDQTQPFESYTITVAEVGNGASGGTAFTRGPADEVLFAELSGGAGGMVVEAARRFVEGQPMKTAGSWTNTTDGARLVAVSYGNTGPAAGASLTTDVTAYPHSETVVTASGGWTSLSNVEADDDAEANNMTSGTGTAEGTADLTALNLDELIFTDAIINAVYLEEKVHSAPSNQGRIGALNIAPVVNGVLGAYNGPPYTIPTGATAYVYDVTGGGWTRADLLDAAFKLRIQCVRAAGGSSEAQGYWDYARARVTWTYTRPASGPSVPTTGQLHPRGWKDQSAPANGQLFPRRVIA